MIGKRIVGVIAGLALAGTVMLPAPEAKASSYSWVQNQRGSYVRLEAFPISNDELARVHPRQKMKNGSKFWMRCWTDFKRSYTGNYTSKRWFRGQSQDGGYLGYVHSSYVYYQKQVPRC
jgi:hypothetical protein